MTHNQQTDLVEHYSFCLHTHKKSALIGRLDQNLIVDRGLHRWIATSYRYDRCGDLLPRNGLCLKVDDKMAHYWL
jgi:hypothetical protein